MALVFVVALRPFTLFQPFNLKLEQLIDMKFLKFALLGNCFSIFSLRLKFDIKRISSLF